MTTCVTATDTFGADGNIVLLERGTKLVGETRGEVSQGMLLAASDPGTGKVIFITPSETVAPGAKVS